MLLYLDNSFLNRPFDDPDIATNKLEAEILSLIIKLAQNGRVNLVNSSVLEYENSLNRILERKIFVKEILKKAKIYKNVNSEIKKQAEILQKTTNISSIDALHIAVAASSKADFFITCDYDIIKKYKGKVRIINPLEFIQHYEHSK